MGLTDRLKGVKETLTKGGVRRVQSLDEFKELYFEELLNSKGIKGYFSQDDERVTVEQAKKTDPGKFYDLASIVDGNYGQYGKRQFEEPGIVRKWLARPLRAAGAGLAAYAHYVFTVTYSPEAYYVLMKPAMGMMVGADVLEGMSYLYHNHKGYDFLQIPRVVAEGLAEKGLAAIPAIVTPGIEATLGQTKFDRAVSRKILYRSRNDFIKMHGEYVAPEKTYHIVPEIPEDTTVLKFPRRVDPSAFKVPTTRAA